MTRKELLDEEGWRRLPNGDQHRCPPSCGVTHDCYFRGKARRKTHTASFTRGLVTKAAGADAEDRFVRLLHQAGVTPEQLRAALAPETRTVERFMPLARGRGIAADYLPRGVLLRARAPVQAKEWQDPLRSDVFGFRGSPSGAEPAFARGGEGVMLPPES
jgi:hypothetical protein